MRYLIALLLLTSSMYALSVKEKKDNFRKLIIPAIEHVYDELNTKYVETEHYIHRSNSIHKKQISELKKHYKVNTDEELLMRLKPHPKSIAAAQAAMESAWATSRFFKKANNIFGVWSFNKNEPRIAAGETRGTKTIWLKKYDTIEDSIRNYYKVIATGKAFKEFRKLKMKTENPYELVKKLDKYSEIGDKYGEELSAMIKYNKFYLLDE